MTAQPPTPLAARPRYQLPLIAMSVGTGLVIFTYLLLLVTRDLDPESPVARILFGIVVTLIAATVAVDRRRNTEQIKDHIDRRISEVAARMDRRMAVLGNAMAEHGVALDDITGELPRMRRDLATHTHTHHLVPAVVGRATVYEAEEKPTGLDPAVLEIGRRIADRLEN